MDRGVGGPSPQRRWARGLAAVLVAAVLAGCASAPSARQDARRGACRLSADVFPVPAAGVRARVPRGYDVSRYAADGRAAVAVWVLDCTRAPLGPQPGRPGVLVLVGAVIADPRARSTGAPLPLRSTHHYLLWSQVSRPGLAACLRAAGLPVATVPGLRTQRRGGRRITRVPWRSAPFTISSPLRGRRDRPHDHANTWWHDGPDGRAAALRLRARAADDVFCPEDRCGTLTTAAGPLARVLGARSRRAVVSLDHLPLDPDVSLSTPCRAR